MPGEYPLPFLSREDTDDRLKVLGFTFRGLDPELLLGTRQRKMFTALQELIAGAIAEWSDARPEGDEETWDNYNNELNTWVQEWLVG